MCCMTHNVRDDLEDAGELARLLTSDPQMRCQCQFGAPCWRRMTQEDLLCDWCRGRDHALACEELEGLKFGWRRKRLADLIQSGRLTTPQG